LRFELVVLGTSGAVPTAGRYASAHLLRAEATDVLIDCGEGTQLRLQEAGVGLGRVRHILISHLHGDHYFGLPGLITSQALQSRSVPLTVVSPPGLRDKLASLLELDRYRLPFELDFVEHAATDFSYLLDSGELRISTFPLRHRIATNGYRIEEHPRQPNIRKDQLERYGIPYTAIPGIKAGEDFVTSSGERVPSTELLTPASAPRSYAYCSDTVYFPELAAWVKGTDLLYHEATFLHELADEARKKGHATAHEAAEIARAANAGQLILGHFSTRYSNVDAHEAEARTIFPNSFAARDLYRFVVPYTGRNLPTNS
jgi:ribonuclease Z